MPRSRLLQPIPALSLEAISALLSDEAAPEPMVEYEAPAAAGAAATADAPRSDGEAASLPLLVEPETTAMSSDGGNVAVGASSRLVLGRRRTQDPFSPWTYRRAETRALAELGAGAVTCAAWLALPGRGRNVVLVAGTSGGWLLLFDEDGKLLHSQPLRADGAVRVHFGANDVQLLFPWAIARVQGADICKLLAEPRPAARLPVRMVELGGQQSTNDAVFVGVLAPKTHELTGAGREVRRLLAAGRAPPLAVYDAREGEADISVVSIATEAAKLVSSLASQWLWGAPAADAAAEPAPEAAARPEYLAPRGSLAASDADRRLLTLEPCRSASLVAATDGFARVLVLDCALASPSVTVVRMFKGYRDAMVGWIHSSKRPLLCIYAPKRGLLEIWPPRSGPRLAAANVGLGRTLLDTSVLALSAVNTAVQANGQPAVEPHQLFLLGDDGLVEKVVLESAAAVSPLKLESAHAIDGVSADDQPKFRKVLRSLASTDGADTIISLIRTLNDGSLLASVRAIVEARPSDIALNWRATQTALEVAGGSQTAAPALVSELTRRERVLRAGAIAYGAEPIAATEDAAAEDADELRGRFVGWETDAEVLGQSPVACDLGTRDGFYLLASERLRRADRAVRGARGAPSPISLLLESLSNADDGGGGAGFHVVEGRAAQAASLFSPLAQKNFAVGLTMASLEILALSDADRWSVFLAWYWALPCEFLLSMRASAGQCAIGRWLSLQALGGEGAAAALSACEDAGGEDAPLLCHALVLVEVAAMLEQRDGAGGSGWALLLPKIRTVWLVHLHVEVVSGARIWPTVRSLQGGGASLARTMAVNRTAASAFTLDATLSPEAAAAEDERWMAGERGGLRARAHAMRSLRTRFPRYCAPPIAALEGGLEACGRWNGKWTAASALSEADAALEALAGNGAPDGAQAVAAMVMWQANCSVAFLRLVQGMEGIGDTLHYKEEARREGLLRSEGGQGQLIYSIRRALRVFASQLRKMLPHAGAAVDVVQLQRYFGGGDDDGGESGAAWPPVLSTTLTAKIASAAMAVAALSVPLVHEFLALLEATQCLVLFDIPDVRLGSLFLTMGAADAAAADAPPLAPLRAALGAAHDGASREMAALHAERRVLLRRVLEHDFDSSLELAQQLHEPQEDVRREYIALCYEEGREAEAELAPEIERVEDRRALGVALLGVARLRFASVISAAAARHELYTANYKPKSLREEREYKLSRSISAELKEWVLIVGGVGEKGAEVHALASLLGVVGSLLGPEDAEELRRTAQMRALVM